MRQRLQRLGYIAGFLGVLLAVVALVRVGDTGERLTDVREELLVAIQGVRLNDIRTLSARVEAVREDLSKVSGDLRTLTGEVQATRTRLDQLSKDLAALNARVVAMDSGRIEDLTQRLGALGGELAQLAQRLARLEAEQAKVLAALAQVDQLRQELAALQARLSALETEKTEPLWQHVRGLRAEMAGLQERLSQMRAEQAQALAELAALGLRVAVADAETLFVRVFLPQVAEERSALMAKTQALQELQARLAQGQITPEAYTQEYLRLQAEHLQAQAQVNMAMLAKMLASPGFASLRGELQALRAQAQPLAARAEALARQAQVVILNPPEFLSEIQQLQAAFQQVDQLLTQVAALKILEVAQGLAREAGCHLVLRVKDVVMYRAEPVVDLTPELEKRLGALFGS